MKYCLLTGAGFSRNWGGWLAAEVFEYLLGCPGIEDEVRKRLWADRAQQRGFEETLAALQRQADSGDRTAKRQLGQFQDAIRKMFDEMNEALASAKFNPSSDTRFAVTRFLTRFDAIFTLNQDWLLETHYLNDNVSLESGPKRWSGFVLPGIRLRRDQLREHGAPPISVPADKNFDHQLPDHSQPYFKLHGSSRWESAEGGSLLVMGGNKEDAIHSVPLLQWYYEKFVESISQGRARLMIVGYGFQDEHINKAIRQAAKESDLKLFLVDPDGVDVVSKYDPRQLVQPRYELAQELQSAIVGASRRSLVATFSGDSVEHSKLMRFFSE